jgi:hypothetical protein
VGRSVGRVRTVHRSADGGPAGRLVHLLSVVVLTRWNDGGAVPTSALEVVDGEVRELIRRRGLDPIREDAPGFHADYLG